MNLDLKDGKVNALTIIHLHLEVSEVAQDLALANTWQCLSLKLH